MSDPLASALARIAPTVNVGASRDLFERTRDGGAAPAPERRPRRLLVAASVLLVLVGAIGVWAVAGRDGNAPAVTPADERGSGTEFRVVAREPVGEGDTRSLRAAGAPDDLDAFVQPYGADVVLDASSIDLANEVALVIVRNGNSCPDDLAHFEPTGDEWVAVWERQGGGGCEDLSLGWVYLVAVERSALPGIQWFVDPAQQQGPLSWDELRVAVPGTVPPPTSTPAVRPPVPSSDELAERLRRFPLPNAFDPLELLQLSDAHERGEDWTGTLSGVLFQDVPAGEWWICWEILESLPEQCGTGIRLLDAPSRYVAQPELFDEQRSDDTGPVAVVISRDPHPVRGTWFDDAAIFAEDTTTASDADVTPDVEVAVEPGRVALIDATSARFGQVFAADGQAAYDAIWAEVGDARRQPAIDFERDVAVGFVVRDDACPPEFEGFDTSEGPDGSTWTPVLIETTTTCRIPLVNRLILVAVGREELDDRTTFRLPADPVDGYAEQTVTLVREVVAVTDVDWGCAGPTGSSFTIAFELPIASQLQVDVVDGDAKLGSGTLGSDGAGPFTMEFGLSSPPSPTAVAVVTDVTTGTEVARVPLSGLPVPTCG